MRAGAEPSIAAADVVRLGAREAVVVKPAGLSSEAPGAGRPGAPRTLIEQVRTLLGWPDAQLPHRLDRPTRGFVVVARDRAAVAEHNASMRAGLWTKRYLARVRPATGIDPDELVGEHRAYLRREGAVARVVRSGGDPSTLAVEAVAPSPARAGEFHAVVLLGTGRYHQVRVMLAHLGAPLAGDREYGGPPGAMYLEHAWLAHPSIDDGGRVVDWRPGDPRREPVDPSIVAALSARS